MYYVVQENTFRESNYDNLIKSLERLGLDYEVVKVLPFTDDVDIKTDRNDVFVFGSIKLARISKQRNWYPGSLMGPTHDYDIYKNYYTDNLLNYDSLVCKFGDKFDLSNPKFIRPCEDTKTFTGKLFDKPSWEEFVKYSLTNGHETSLNKEIRIQVATPKKIYKEIRCWVVDGKVVDASQYRLGNRMVMDANVDPEALEFAHEMVDIYQLAKAFVIDVCLTEDGWKIVECGCINCAGFYAINLMKVLEALEVMYEKN